MPKDFWTGSVRGVRGVWPWSAARPTWCTLAWPVTMCCVPKWIVHALVVMCIAVMPGGICAQPVGGTVTGNNQGAGSVAVALETFGVGNVSRPGEWVGVRIKLTDSSPRERNVLVRLAVTDPDGDTAVAQRQLTLNPGVAQGSWLYFRLPFAFDASRGVVASVHEALEPETGSESREYLPGKLLARQPLTPTPANSVLPKTLGVLAAIGGDELGLKRYSTRLDGAGAKGTYTPYGHEATEVVTGLTPAGMPDRWMGYAPMWGLVWGPGVEPTEVRGDQARAVREWVERGGHLVVVLPSVGQQWTNPETNELHSIMPVVSVSRREGVDMEPYRALLQRTRTPSALSKSGVVHNFTPMAQAGPGEAIRVLNGPDGQCVVARRLVGAGMVTLIGLDLGAPSMRASVRADVFWHRIFGRRGSLDGGSAETLSLGAASQREVTIYDETVSEIIEKRGRAQGGLLLGFVVFVVYWLVAGPVGYAILKNRKKTQHAWTAFVAASALFTGFAWGGASLLRPGTVEVSHMTFLDHVYGQPLSKARMWASVLLPKYGDATIAIGDPTELGSTRSPGVISAWDQPQEDAARVSFLDARDYVVDARSWETMRVPARWTIKQVQADWSGGPRWKMPRPIAADGSTEGTLRVVGLVPNSTTGIVDGILRHELPGALRDVVIVVVRGQSEIAPVIEPRDPVKATSSTSDSSGRSRGMTTDGALFADAFMFSYSLWKPGEDLDLSIVTRGSQGETSATRGLRRYSPVGESPSAITGFLQRTLPPRDWATGVAFLPLLEPPDFDTSTPAGQRASVVRVMTHGLDLARWFTSPCVIVIGVVDTNEDGNGVESPVPIAVDGVLAKSSGTTIVRWVYPLPDEAPLYRPALGEAAETIETGIDSARTPGT